MKYEELIDEELARKDPTCLGCGMDKHQGLIVCWDCFKHRRDVTPLKYFAGSFGAWLDVVESVERRNQMEAAL